MRKALVTLIDLQEIDCELKKLEKMKGDLPIKVQSLRVDADRLSETLNQDRKALEENENASKTLKNEVEMLKQKLDKYRKQLYQVTTNREYDAITAEIENTESSIEEKEFTGLELEEKEANLREKISAAEEELDQKTLVLDEMRTELEKRLAITANSQQEFLSKREKVISKLSKQLLSNYERIRNGKNGVALALLSNGACSECSSRIPPQRAMEIRAMDRIYLCEVCGRILIWRPETSEVCDPASESSNVVSESNT